ncbi:MAG: ATP-binding protein [Elusimicrobia bacterium]|nr:ATP-binding protein [Elusimicrobiota bacterium]
MNTKGGFADIQLENILIPYNPWWKDGIVKTEHFKRPVFNKIYKDLLSLKQIISITGPRRVGKTTLLRQIIQSLIQEKQIPPSEIIYFSFDDPLLVDIHVHERFFDDLMKWANVKHKDKIVYFFFDEVQKFERWELYLKKYYDLGFPVRFIISGSASSPIFRKSRESLLGRIKDNHLLPFSFKEFVYFNKANDPEVLDFVNRTNDFGYKLQREIVVDWLGFKNDLLHISNHVIEELQCLLDNYFVEGGFPETWEIKDIVSKQEYLFDNQVQKVIFEDLVIATEFRKPEKIKNYYLSLIEQPGQEINVEKSSQKIGVSRAMLEKYLPLLEMTDLIKTLPRFSKRPLKYRRGSVKCYLVDLALRNAILKLNESILSDAIILGLYAENLVFNALRKFEGAIELSYFKDARREIDFIVHLGGKRYLPIEVKYRDNIDDIAPIKYFVQEYDQNVGIVVTKKFIQNQEDNRIIFIPLPIFLLFF